MNVLLARAGKMEHNGPALQIARDEIGSVPA